MFRFRGSSGFTLLELLVVVGMIAVILGAMTTSMSAARRRARPEGDERRQGHLPGDSRLRELGAVEQLRAADLRVAG